MLAVLPAPAPQPMEGATGEGQRLHGRSAGADFAVDLIHGRRHYCFEPGFLERALAAAEAGQIDFLSVYLKPEFHTLMESTLSPYGVALYFCGIDPRRDPAAAFNGQCLLVNRNAYQFVGGHKALLSYVCEDVKLAALAQRHRLKFTVARAPRLGRVRIRPEDFERNASRFVLVSL